MSETGKYNLLIVDDDCAICEYLEGEYSERFHVNSANSHHEALEFLKDNTPDIALIDLKLTENADDPDPNESVGYDLVKRIRKQDERVHIIVMTAHHRSTETAMKAVSCGANNYIKKPFVKAEVSLDTKISEGIERLVSLDEKSKSKGKTDSRRTRARQAAAASAITTPRQSMQEILETIEKIARRDCSVLITGETGVGKRYFAELIHEKSKRQKKLIAYNCSSNTSLVESELFGHVKGAFTGANNRKRGLFEAAENGTLFLDEIGTMPTESQEKLLTFLDDRVVRPMGETEGRKVNVRVIAATNSDVGEAINAGTFREDLFYRLNTVWLHIPPLRERKDEIPRLCGLLLKEIYGDDHANKKRISRDEAKKLKNYDWPGNIRELKNCIEKAASIRKGRSVMACDIIKTSKTPNGGD